MMGSGILSITFTIEMRSVLSFSSDLGTEIIKIS